MTTKTCRKCGTEKPIDGFYRQKTSSDGHGAYCKSCNQAVVKDWVSKNPDRARAHKRAYKYGISQEDYDKLFDQQGGKCALCKQEKSLSVDHDHETGRIRGLLCHKCNTSIDRACAVFYGEARAYLDGAYGLPE